MITAVSPQKPDNDEDRPLDCNQAMEIAFARLLSDAVVAGWREMEVAIILADMAKDHVLRLATAPHEDEFN